MALDLTTVNAKLRRSQQHLRSLMDVIKSGLNADNYRAVKETNSDSTRYGIFLRVKQELPFEDLSLMVGDCIHNLRSALDHLVYAVAIHESGSNPPPDHDSLMFPIASAPVNFQGGKERIKSLSLQVRTAIERLQPYNRPHPEIPPALGLLRAFDDSDKHRLLQIAIAVFHKAELGTLTNIPVGQIYNISINLKPMKDGAEIAALIFDRPTPNVTYEWQGDLMVALRHERGPLGNVLSEVGAIIKLLTDEVLFVIAEVTKEVR